MIDHLGVSATTSRVTAQGKCTLCLAIDLPIGGVQRSEQEHTSLQALRITNRGYGYVEYRSWPGEGRKRGRDHHGSNIANLNRGCGNLNSQPLQDVGQGLRGELGLLAVPSSVESDNDAVTDQGIFPNAFDGCNVSNQHLASVRGPRSTVSTEKQQRNEKQDCQPKRPRGKPSQARASSS